MVQYVCPRCHYNSKLKNDLRRHFKRKHPCKPKFSNKSILECIDEVLGENNNIYTVNNASLDNNIIEKSFINTNSFMNNNSYETLQYLQKMELVYACKYCDKQFSHRQAKHRHEIACGEKLKNYFTKEEVDKKLAEKDILINELRNQIGQLLEKVGDTYNNNTYNIMIKPFGKENTSYITADYVNRIINDGPVNSIPKLIKYIHFHPEHKENHNVKIPNKKQPYAQIYNGTKWEYQSKKDTIERMSDRAYSILNIHYSGGNDYMNQFKTIFDQKNAELSKRLLQDIELIIINNQGVDNK